MSVWKSFMAVYHEYPWLVLTVLGCSLALNAIFLYVENTRTTAEPADGDKSEN